MAERYDLKPEQIKLIEKTLTIHYGDEPTGFEAFRAVSEILKTEDIEFLKRTLELLFDAYRNDQILLDQIKNQSMNLTSYIERGIK
jgi:hypothetical protein